MKRNPLAMMLLTGLAGLCLAGLPGRGQEKKAAQEIVSEFYPLKVGHRWTYVGNDVKERVVVTVEKQEPIRRKANLAIGEKSEQIESFFLRITSGDKSLMEQVFVTEDGVYRYAAAGKEIVPPLKILSLPPRKDEVWPCDSESEALRLRGSFLVKQEPVTVPQGSHNAWKSSTRDFFLGEQKLEAQYYFAANVGIVKQHIKLGKFDLKLELEKFEPAGATGLPSINLPLIPPPPPPGK